MLEQALELPEDKDLPWARLASAEGKSQAWHPTVAAIKAGRAERPPLGALREPSAAASLAVGPESQAMEATEKNAGKRCAARI